MFTGKLLLFDGLVNTMTTGKASRMTNIKLKQIVTQQFIRIQSDNSNTK